MQYLLWLGLFIPLVGFLFLMCTSQVIRRRETGIVACATVLISFLSFVSLLFLHGREGTFEQKELLFHWIALFDIKADFALHLDTLSMLMSLIITGVGFLIHVYSIGYMEKEEDFARYFACLNFFIFAMLLLVLADNLLLLFVGWEGVGLASYLLIGYWYERPAAAQAATKAFVINRIGDLGLLLGLLLTYILFGTGNIESISQKAAAQFAVGAPVISLLALLYFIGAVGKSAQLPLYTWLPDAMEGPTPVSALIHAATMVTAGVYLVVRMHPIFNLAPDLMLLIGIIGGSTALFAAICAIGQTDLKRVLAFSTISQLGLMFLACGVGAFYAAMFHLTTHAFVKALLFLSAGNVVHLLHDVTDMRKMGGLAEQLPKTKMLFLIGVLALSGVPPLAPFFSKDLILEEEHLSGLSLLFYVGLAASILTGFYLMRAYCLTFLGRSRIEERILHSIHEAPKVMLFPNAILALFSIGIGFLGFAFGDKSILETFLSEEGIVDKFFAGNFIWTFETLLSVVGVIMGLALSAYLYTRPIARLTSPTLLSRAFFVDEIYWKGIVVPLKGLATFILNWSEPVIGQQSIRAITNSTHGVSVWLQQIQSGLIRSYLAWMVFGIVILVIYLAF